MDIDVGGWVLFGCFSFLVKKSKVKVESDVEGGGNRVLVKRKEVAC